MRELTVNELNLVSGGQAPAQCKPENVIGGVGDMQGLGQDLINFYESLVQATSYIIERVANSL